MLLLSLGGINFEKATCCTYAFVSVCLCVMFDTQFENMQPLNYFNS